MNQLTPEAILEAICNINVTNKGTIDEIEMVNVNPYKLAEFLSTLMSR